MAIHLNNKEIKDICLGSQEVKEVYLGNKKVWEKSQPVPAWEGLKFTSAQDNSSVYYSIHGSLPNIDINCSLDDGNTWTAWDGTAITLNNGDTLCVKNNADTLSTSTSDYFSFTIRGTISASGNCNSMINFSELSNYCYYRMFARTLITKAPDLPATTLAESCYQAMFLGCTGLTSAPDLPATTLANNCYYQMFYRCSLLSNIKLYYTGNFSSLYFSNWVYSVSSTGTFYYNGSDTTTGTSAIPTGWTVQTF